MIEEVPSYFEAISSKDVVMVLLLVVLLATNAAHIWACVCAIAERLYGWAGVVIVALCDGLLFLPRRVKWWFTAGYVPVEVDLARLDAEDVVSLLDVPAEPYIVEIEGKKRVVCSGQLSGTTYLWRPEILRYGDFGTNSQGEEKDTPAGALEIKSDQVPKCLAFLVDQESGTVIGQCCRLKTDEFDGLITAQHVAHVVQQYMSIGRKIQIVSTRQAVALEKEPQVIDFGACDVAVLMVGESCMSKLQLQSARVDHTARNVVRLFYFKGGKWFCSFGVLTNSKGMKPFQRLHNASTRSGASGAVSISGNAVSVVHTGFQPDGNTCVDIRPFYARRDLDLGLESDVPRISPRRERLLDPEEVDKDAVLSKLYGPPGRELYRVINSDGTSGLINRAVAKSIAQLEEWTAKKRAAGETLWADMDDDDDEFESSILLHKRTGRVTGYASKHNAETRFRQGKPQSLPPDMSPAQIEGFLMALGASREEIARFRSRDSQNATGSEAQPKVDDAKPSALGKGEEAKVGLPQAKVSGRVEVVAQKAEQPNKQPSKPKRKRNRKPAKAGPAASGKGEEAKVGLPQAKASEPKASGVENASVPLASDDAESKSSPLANQDFRQGRRQ